MKTEELLHREIKQEFEKLKDMEIGTDNYKTTVDGLTKLVDRAIEIDKMNIDHEHNVKVRNDENIDRAFKHALAFIGMALTTGTAIWGTVVCLEFEKENTITTFFGRGWLNKLLPRK